MIAIGIYQYQQNNHYQQKIRMELVNLKVIKGENVQYLIPLGSGSWWIVTPKDAEPIGL